MEDTPFCPICASKLKVTDSAGLGYIVKSCKKSALHHTFQLLYSQTKERVNWIYFSLPGTANSRFIDIDFVEGISRISCYKNDVPQSFDVARVLQPDFPTLDKLKELVNTLVLFS